MSVSGISNTTSSVAQSLFTKPKQDLQSLQSALNSGDLTGAQQDFSDFKKDVAGIFDSAAAPSGPAQAGANLQSLQGALGSGDVAGAQKDLAALLQALQGSNGPHKHHHHRHHQASPTQDSDTAGSAPTGVTPGTTGGTSDLRAAVMAAYQAFAGAGSTGLGLNATA